MVSAVPTVVVAVTIPAVVPPVAAVVRTLGGGGEDHLVPGRSRGSQAQEHCEDAQEGE